MAIPTQGEGMANVKGGGDLFDLETPAVLHWRMNDIHFYFSFADLSFAVFCCLSLHP